MTKGDPDIYREAVKKVGGKIEDAIFLMITWRL